MKHTCKRLTALVLALAMCLSLLSATAWAADVSGGGYTDDPLVAETETEEDSSAAEAEDEAEAEEPAEEEVTEEQPQEKADAAESEGAEEETVVSAAEDETEESTIIDSGTCGDNLTWVLDADYVLTISGTGDMTDWSGTSGIPWYSYRKSITAVTIGDDVTSIGGYAFYNCTNLTSVTIGDSVTSIGERAFYACKNLTSLTIPDSVTTIGDRAFSGCTGLTSAPIGNGVTSIGSYAFYGCTGLTSVTVGNGITSIGDSAFYACTRLTDVYYTGSEEDWAAISIGSSNTWLTNATIHYKSVFAIVTQPEDVTAVKGTSATFTVEATGTDLTYQWQYQTANGSKWYNCTATTGEGYDSASVTLTANKGRNGYKYRCVVTNGNGESLTSEQAVLTVTDTIVVTTQPEDVTAVKGDSVTLTVEAASNQEENLTYQWQYMTATGSKWYNCTATTGEGYNTSSVTLTANSGRNGYQYRCKITDESGNVVYTDVITLTVTTE